jgi:hypothetical protein
VSASWPQPPPQFWQADKQPQSKQADKQPQSWQADKLPQSTHAKGEAGAFQHRIYMYSVVISIRGGVVATRLYTRT